MGANTFGHIFCVTTCGESHGKALACIIDNCPPGVEISEEYIQVQLDRRRPGSTRFGTPRNEADAVKIISGVFEGKTTGTPIGLIIENTSQRSQDYSEIMNSYRPGHADYTYNMKYGVRDYRGGGRSSARETAMRVAAGAVAKAVLEKLFGVTIDGCVTAIGPHSTTNYDAKAALNNALNFASSDEQELAKISDYMDELRLAQDSCGAVIEVRAHGVPVGTGSPVFDRLDATLAHAMMSINAVKGVEIGDGFAMAAMKGSQSRDEISKNGFLSNHAGGILGGIATGQDIKVRMAFKPTSSIMTPGKSIDKYGNEIKELVTKGRHDPCVGIRAVPIAEAMMALTILDAIMLDKAQCSSVDRDAIFHIPVQFSQKYFLFQQKMPQEKNMNALDTIKSHQSVRRFTGEKITAEQMGAIEDAIAQTSSTCFYQFVTTIKVQDPVKLEQIAKFSGEQDHIAKCSHFLVFCLDMTKLMHIADVKPPFGFRFLIGGFNDCSLVCQNALTAAESIGLGGVIIGGYKAGIKTLSDMLKLPKGVVPLLALCLGVPDKEYLEEQKPRLPRSWFIMDEEYHDPFNEQELQEYDAKVNEYFQNRKYNQRSDTWTNSSKAMLKGTLAPATGVIEYLKAQGFDFI